MPQTIRTFSLDAYVFPQADIPARGPIEVVTPQRWARHSVIGTVQPGDIMTFIGFGSQDWDFISKCVEATRNKLQAVFNARAEVVFKTPEESGGFNVLMDSLNIEHLTAQEDSKFLCRFHLIRRA